MAELYRTVAINDSANNYTGIEGDWNIIVTGPTSGEPGANPEQFMGMAWATCLNATIQALFKNRKWTNRSRVRVVVTLNPEPSGSGLYFTMTAYVAVEGLDDAETAKAADQAHRRCPVSKLINAYEHVKVEIEAY